MLPSSCRRVRPATRRHGGDRGARPRLGAAHDARRRQWSRHGAVGGGRALAGPAGAHRLGARARAVALGDNSPQQSPHAAVQRPPGARDAGTPPPRDVPSYDLIVIGHVLNELDEALRREVVAFAWQHCGGVLLLVAPGTSAAFARGEGGARPSLAAGGARWPLRPRSALSAGRRLVPLPAAPAAAGCSSAAPGMRRGGRRASSRVTALGAWRRQMTRFLGPPHPPAAPTPRLCRLRYRATRDRLAGTQRQREVYARARSFRWGDALAAPPDEETGSGL